MERVYTISNVYTLAANASMMFAGTPTNPTKLNPLNIISDSTPIKIELFEAPTITTPGTAVTPTATNRVSTTASTTVVQSAPTVSANGTPIFTSLANGSKNSGGLLNSEYNFNLKPGVTYLYKITYLGTGTATLSADLVWAEYF
jgi:hypothetical protein